MELIPIASNLFIDNGGPSDMTDKKAYKLIADRAAKLAAMPTIKKRMKERYTENRYKGMTDNEAIGEVQNFLYQFAIATLYGV